MNQSGYSQAWKYAARVVGLTGAVLILNTQSNAAITCARTVTANIVVIDQPLMFNRLGASNVNGMIFALARDVIHKTTREPLTAGGAAVAGNVELRPDRRARPLVLRVAAGDCLDVTLTNLLTPAANPNNVLPANTPPFNIPINEQVADRHVSFQASGTQLRVDINDDGSMVGKNPGAAGSLIAPGGSHTYRLHAPREGAYIIQSYGATIGSEGNMGNAANGLFGELIVEPPAARIYRGQVVEEEMRLATTGATPTGQPKIDYEAIYPSTEPWLSEGKAGLPVLNMICNAAARATGKCAGNEIVHAEINAIVAGPNADGTFPASTYPLERVGKRNPTVPNRLEPFRDLAQVWHDEAASAQAFPGFFDLDPVFRHVLHGVRDAFMINYGSGGVGAEIVANRLGVGPMHDCLNCAYEEFFLTSFTVGDPAMLVDTPANVGLENLMPGQAPNPADLGPKANFALGAEDPSNVHHAYIGDFTKFRNVHFGKEQHLFHLHNHQWLYNPNDDNSNYLDAQGLGPGVGYTYEINFGGAGNRNKSAGDAIFHCHFYPHFAQGMWYLFRIHDVMETGTKLAVSGADFHATRWALENTTPAGGARALPDGEIVAGTPIPAVVPLPGKALPPMPGQVTVKPKIGANNITVGSNADVIDRTKNPGYPFWIGGIEDIVGQRPTTPPLDMLDAAKATQLRTSGDPLWAKLDSEQADGWDGGLRRHALQGYADGGSAVSTVNELDFSKTVERAKPMYYAEEGTDIEQVAMRFHAQRNHASSKVDFNGVVTAANFVVNGAPPVVGAPYHEPCIDDTGQQLGTGVVGRYFSGETRTATSTRGSSVFNADSPRVYKGANIQFDAVLNKVGYHFPQQRILTLWEDAVPVINKAQPPEPLVMRLNTFDCAVYHHTNLVPEYYEMDDYQVRTPTDIIGQHIHLPKWDLTTADGAANGWNYEDGTLSPGSVRERIHAIRVFNACAEPDARDNSDACPVAKAHPFFGQYGRDDWIGARTTQQRWFADPVVNTEGVDRGLGIVFTHDHYGPSTHQQVGLYATVLIQPAGSRWVHNETGAQLGAGPDGSGGRADGGPTSWQAAILPPTAPIAGNTVKSETLKSFREFFFQFSDFQHAYEKGVYVGADEYGKPLPGATPRDRFKGVASIDDAFRYAINPQTRQQINPVFPDLVVEVKGGVVPGCPRRPCPTAISVEDPGMLVVNYRSEPVGLRVYDPNKSGPDGKPGMQADGLAGDLAYALQTRTDRKIAPLNTVIGYAPASYTQLNGGVAPGDPFTPVLRTYSGDLVRVKIQAGANEEEHNATIYGVKWLQAGSGHGSAPNSGWRNSQAAGISEQFTLTTPVLMESSQKSETADYAYNIDASNDGWWSGTWGVMRNYGLLRNDLFALPSNPKPIRPQNIVEFNEGCPPALLSPRRSYDVTAVGANAVLQNSLGVTIVPTGDAATQHVGGALAASGGTLVYNPRDTAIPARTLEDGATIGGHSGPLHDPTALFYTHTSFLDANGTLKPSMPLEPLTLRAAAGECMRVTLRNRLPAKAPDLASLGNLLGVVKRDRNNPQGSTTFNNNLIRASSHVGLHPQLMEYDVTQSDGMNVGLNPVQTVAPGGQRTYRWYAGHHRLANLRAILSGETLTRIAARTGRPVTDLQRLADMDMIIAVPIEFGGSNLTPADPIKQGAKGMVGATVIEPLLSNWSVDDAVLVPDRQNPANTRLTRMATTVKNASGTTLFRDFSIVLQKALTLRYKDGAPVEHMNGEGFGIPEDSQDSSNMGINYGSEPLWFRLGIAPNAPFGHAAGAGFGDSPNAHEAYSNVLTSGTDPVTSVFTATRGQQVRMRVTNAYSTSRGSTFHLHGHVWQRDPYLCPLEARNGLAGACFINTIAGPSRAIGTNPIGFTQGGQESLTPLSHFDIVLQRAGGDNLVAGDYLFRDQASFGSANGLWGILRVQ